MARKLRIQKRGSKDYRLTSIPAGGRKVGKGRLRRRGVR